VHDQRGPVLRHHQTVRIRGEADTTSDAGVRVAGMAGCGVHKSTARTHTGQRALNRGRCTALHCVPKLRLPDLRDAGLVLHTSDGHDNRVL